MELLDALLGIGTSMMVEVVVGLDRSEGEVEAVLSVMR